VWDDAWVAKCHDNEEKLLLGFWNARDGGRASLLCSRRLKKWRVVRWLSAVVEIELQVKLR
jgi:hypothetical protein